MLLRDDVFSIARTLPGTMMDTPFEDDFDTTVLRHGDTGKWYGLVFKAPCRKVGIDRDGQTDIVNLKCDPVVSFGFIESFEAIMPAYHMNKYHWITIVLETGVPKDILEMLIRMSFDLTKAKPRRQNRKAAQKD